MTLLWSYFPLPFIFPCWFPLSNWVYFDSIGVSALISISFLPLSSSPLPRRYRAPPLHHLNCCPQCGIHSVGVLPLIEALRFVLVSRILAWTELLFTYGTNCSSSAKYESFGFVTLILPRFCILFALTNVFAPRQCGLMSFFVHFTLLNYISLFLPSV